ncbi:mitochondrial import inner membrane translocase subunit TIM50-like [Zingiber officinale]|uniref:mitochondrial import inner membrane translocase subunit TIM50-like n=1 Tax=Zingiber officinale TaxID=94328 RepID=UPI001C4D1FE3|nr:mitochondrial import inner membrane translocase subunit TIM50-like [Zingiber officinale]
MTVKKQSNESSNPFKNPFESISELVSFAMAFRFARSRSLSLLAKFRIEHRTLNVSAAPPKEPLSSSDALFSDQPSSLSSPIQPPSPPPPSSGAARRSWGLLKYGSVAALTAAVGTTAYVTYAYSLEELEHKANTLRETAKGSRGEDDESTLQKFNNLLYSTAMKVPVKALDLYLDLRRATEEHVRGFTEPSSEKLLPDLHPQEQHAFTLVLDLNETLVYSDWKRDRGWRTFKRPGIDAFLEHLGKLYEIVVYSDQLNMYVDPVIERLDQKGYIRHKLSRAATKYVNGKHYRDLSKLNRDPSRIIYISGHALESCLQPENSVPIKPWKLENDDTALLDLIPFLEYVALHRPADIRQVLASFQGHDIPTEFIERSKEYQRKMQEQKQHGRFWKR